MNDLVDLDGALARLERDTDGLAAVVDSADLTAPVAACPGWDVRALAVHVGTIHRWATVAVRTAAPPERGAVARPDDGASPEELAAWLRLGAGVLADVLATTEPTAPSWHPFPWEQSARFWPRRQMVETALHRWDAEVATAGESTIEPEVGVVGIGEYFELGLPRVLQLAELDAPAPSLHVHVTDDGLPEGAGEWVVDAVDGTLRVREEHRRADAALRGPAADVLLVLMGRLDRSAVEVVGDPDAAAAWLDLPGW